MLVRVRLFAALRERAGSDELELELPEGACVADALERMAALCRDLSVVMAVNREYARADTVLRAGDELALIPPVSGGASITGAVHVHVSSEPLRLDALLERVRSPRAGAVVVFEGVTREVERLEYEAYEAMAEDTMLEIAAAAVERYGLCAAAVEHRVGAVSLSEPSVIVAVSAPHRPEAFAGAREIIDRLKARAPIWKREEGRWAKGATPQAPD
jgi:molybdopterin converting factor subunit 1